MEYTELSADQRKAMLKDRIRAYEMDHFGHEMNKAALANQSTDEQVEQAIADADKAQAVIEAAVDACKTELAALDSTPSE